MVITFRPEFEPPWIGQAHTTLIALNRLNVEDCLALARSVDGGRELSAELTEQIARRTDGIPLFVEELTKSIAESRLLIELDQGDSPAAPLPEPEIPATLQDLLEARLDRLGPAKEIAHIGAAIGREFDYRLLAAVAGIDGCRFSIPHWTNWWAPSLSSAAARLLTRPSHLSTGSCVTPRTIPY